MKQNPELRLRLISTYPLPLVKGSTSMKWRGSVPFDSIFYDTAEYPGANKFGKLATKYRDRIYHDISKRLSILQLCRGYFLTDLGVHHQILNYHIILAHEMLPLLL